MVNHLHHESSDFKLLIPLRYSKYTHANELSLGYRNGNPKRLYVFEETPTLTIITLSLKFKIICFKTAAYIFTFWQIQIMYIIYNRKLHELQWEIKNYFYWKNNKKKEKKSFPQLQSVLIRIPKRLIRPKVRSFRMESVDNPDKSLKKKIYYF